MLLFDTNILIYSLQGQDRALDLLGNSEDIHSISTVTVMELYGGSITATQTQEVTDLLEVFHVVPVSHTIARMAGGILARLLARGKKRRHKEDVLIAATALHLDVPLVTANWKDFEGIEGLKLRRYLLN